MSYISFFSSYLYFLLRFFLIHYSPPPRVLALLIFRILHLISEQGWEMTTDFSSSQFKGHSTQRRHGFNYNYWKCRMKIYLQSINHELWNIVEATYEKPSTPYDPWTDDQKKSVNLDAKALNVLFCELDKNKFNCVSTSISTHEIWHTLQVTHEGIIKLKKLNVCSCGQVRTISNEDLRNHH